MQRNDFFYLQYNDLNWSHQAQSDMNGFINDFIIDEVILADDNLPLKVFDIGFGIGAFIRRLVLKTNQTSGLLIEGCEPSNKNYNQFNAAPLQVRSGVTLKTHNTVFLDVDTPNRFDLITAIYVFPHIPFEELEPTVEKIHAMLEPGGRFVMVVVNEGYLKSNLDSGNGVYTLVHQVEIELGGTTYTEYLHYTDLPGVGRILDYNRESEFYRRLFDKKGLQLVLERDLDDSGYTCTSFVFRKVR